MTKWELTRHWSVNTPANELQTNAWLAANVAVASIFVTACVAVGIFCAVRPPSDAGLSPPTDLSAAAILPDR